MEQLVELLPCENCRVHYANNLKSDPLTNDILSSKYKLIGWSVKLHNEVNSRTGKKHITVEEAIKIYTSDVEHDDTQWKSTITIVLLVLLIIILIYYVKFRE